MIILGIDPGTATIGYGLIKKIVRGREKGRLKCLKFGTIKTEIKYSDPERLKKIYYSLLKIIREEKPDIIAVENIYFFKNKKTAFAISQVKGIILLASAQKKLPILQIPPLQIKTAIAGYGRASKKQVQRMIKTSLALKELPKPDDIADALGVAICAANLSQFSR
jgi:crossover junction endodeoxyribonuclease RuvC